MGIDDDEGEDGDPSICKYQNKQSDNYVTIYACAQIYANKERLHILVMEREYFLDIHTDLHCKITFIN